MKTDPFPVSNFYRDAFCTTHYYGCYGITIRVKFILIIDHWLNWDFNLNKLEILERRLLLGINTESKIHYSFCLKCLTGLTNNNH